MCVMSDMKRPECLSSLQSIDSAKLCVATETATNGNVGTMTLPPPSKTCRVGISYWSVARAETEPKSPDYHPQNGLTDTIDRPRLDSSLSEGEQVNVFSVEEVIRFFIIIIITVDTPLNIVYSLFEDSYVGLSLRPP